MTNGFPCHKMILRIILIIVLMNGMIGNDDRGGPMQARQNYNTRRWRAFLALMAERNGELLSQRQIMAALEAHRIQVGSSTLYRYLNRLVVEGLASVYSIGHYVPDGDALPQTMASGNARTDGQAQRRQTRYTSLYRFTGGNKKPDVGFLCRCETCGKIFLTGAEATEVLAEALRRECGIELDPCRTILYGRCEECSWKEGNHYGE